MSVEQRDLAGGVRVLTLHNPPANAFDQALRDELAAACDAARTDARVRAVVVTGAGRFFSGGLDLKAVSAGSRADVFGMDFGRNDGAFALWTLPKPTVAMVNGHAIAGGGIICLACDIRIAARSGLKIGLNEVAIGLSFPTGAYEIALSALGERHARRVLLEAGLYDVDTARQLGLIDDVVEPADLERVCIDRARLLGSYGQAAYADTKRSLQRDAVRRVVNETEEQRRATRQIWSSPETKGAIAAQLAKVSGTTRT
ncbi:MAG TPA: enoyl-CoA hydratase/isomerase family protein [Candidatus Acidoferrales bacterium]|nr:enoyl-CoA hydratase/isomerase family protein [Candidatus Acidoferrales bacterium]